MFLTMATSNNNYNDQFKVQGANIVKARFPPFLKEVSVEGNKRRAGLLGKRMKPGGGGETKRCDFLEIVHPNFQSCPALTYSMSH